MEIIQQGSFEVEAVLPRSYAAAPGLVNLGGATDTQIFVGDVKFDDAFDKILGWMDAYPNTEFAFMTAHGGLNYHSTVRRVVDREDVEALRDLQKPKPKKTTTTTTTHADVDHYSNF